MQDKIFVRESAFHFSGDSHPPRDMAMATPDDIINFLIWKDLSGKTTVHVDDCSNFGNKK